MARNTVFGLPLGKQKHPKRDLAMNVAKAAAVVAGPALLVPAAKKVKPVAERASKAAGQAGDLMEKGKEAKGAVSEAMDTASGIKDAIDSHSSTIGKVAGVVKAVASKGGNKGSKPKLSHLLEQHCDIAAPRRTVYDQWTQFEMFPTIVKGIESVQQQEDDDETTTWTAKIGPSRRTWTGKIVEQIPDERIAWKSDGGAQLQGTVTFHDLDVDLTRVLLQMEYKPTGAVEWVGNTLRIQRRRAKRDLRLFKHFLEIRGEETGAWRGTIDADEKLEPAYSGQGKVRRDRRSQDSNRGSGTPAPDPSEEDGRGNGDGRRSRSSGSRSSNGRASSSASSRSGTSRSGGAGSRSGGSRTGASRSGGGRSTSSRAGGSSGGSGGSGGSSNRRSSSGSRSSASRSGSSGSGGGRSGGSGGRNRPSSSSGERRPGNGSSSSRSQGGRRQPARTGS
jgi:uncharacterized membrane protein